MAPHDKSYDGLPLLITDNYCMDVHAMGQDGEEFEVRLLPLPQQCRMNNSNSNTCRLFKPINNLKKQKKNKKQCKAVRFEKHTDIHEIPHKNEIAPEEKALLWNNYHDWNAMQNERQRITRAIIFGHVTLETQTEELFLRGLENLIPTLAAKRRQNMNIAVRHVLREQAQAKSERRSIDVERLALSYGALTHDSKEAAYTQGLDDYYQVLQEYGVRVLSAIV